MSEGFKNVRFEPISEQQLREELDDMRGVEEEMREEMEEVRQERGEERREEGGGAERREERRTETVALNDYLEMEKFFASTLKWSESSHDVLLFSNMNKVSKYIWSYSYLYISIFICFRDIYILCTFFIFKIILLLIFFFFFLNRLFRFCP